MKKTARPQRILSRVWAIQLVLSCAFSLAPARAAEQPLILHLELHGVVNPIKTRHVKQALERAEREHADFVLLSIDTPGGLVSSMQDIVSIITNSPVPVVGFVEPNSAQATSAGALILLATDVAAMQPGTRMGAAHPVGAGQPLEGAVEEKATNTIAALAKSLAARRGRPEDLAAALVVESTSHTAQEALDKKLVELVANDEADLLRQLEGRTFEHAGKPRTLHTHAANRIEVELSWSNELLDTFANPTLASILLSIGVLGITYELAAPGIGMGGIIGLISLCLGLLGMSVLPIQLAGLLLLAAGLIAIGLELALPTHGVLGLGGVLALGFAAVILIDEAGYFGAVQRVDLSLFLPIVVALSLGLLALATVTRKALRAPFQLGPAAMQGKSGTAKSSFEQNGTDFTGSVFVDGALWQAIANADVSNGDAIEVVEVLSQPMRLKVRRKGAL
ncbi:MAG TPA: NfeD family protein [Polyangiales bacterium]|nr:NfeD family protein [Polyangiales bacterium]